MGFSNGTPTISTDGLIFAIDAGNDQSYVSGSGNCFSLIGNITGSLSDDNGSGMYEDINQGTWVFDGVDDYIDLITSPTYTDVTISFWVKRATIASHESLFNGTGFFQWLQILSGRNYLEYYDGSWNTFSGDVSDSIWHHIALVNDTGATEVRSYVDGSLDTTIGSSDATSILYQFGNYGGSSHFITGNYTNIQVYNKILSTTEITQNYNATKGRFT